MIPGVARVDWSYHRKGWSSCARAQEFLAKQKIGVVEQVDTRKSPISGEAALAVARDVDEIWVARGKTAVHVDLKASRPPRAELLAAPAGAHRRPPGADAPGWPDAARRVQRGGVHENLEV